MINEAASFVSDRLPELWLRTCEHLALTGISTLIAILLGIPLGILAFRLSKLRAFLLSAIGILQTIPSLAMLAILLALFQKIGFLPAIVALTLYALLPMVRNTVTGLEQVPASTVEAAVGMGMTWWQRLRLVQLPMALPVIIAGIRTSAVVGVGIATLSAFIGAGGLGQFINRGLALSNTPLILLGAIPAALLAVIVDISIASAGWALHHRRKVERGLPIKFVRYITLLLPCLLFAAGLVVSFSHSIDDSFPGSTEENRPPIRIGSKNFTEQLILAEIMAQLIENKYAVERRFNLGGTMICHKALVKGEIHLYPEYTGTGLTAILNKPPVSEAEEALAIVRNEYKKQFGLEWLVPFGFNNTYAIAVRGQYALKHNIHQISDLKPLAEALRAGFTAEFAERQDGYPGLRNKYGFQFGTVQDLDPGIMYQAIQKKEVDVICAFATDGRIAAYSLKLLKDNRKYFPPYYCAPVISSKTLKNYPEISAALAPLAGAITDSVMQGLNFEVDENKKTASEVAKAFLESLG